MGGHCWQDGGSKDYIDARYEYYATKWNNATLVIRQVIRHLFCEEKFRDFLMRASRMINVRSIFGCPKALGMVSDEPAARLLAAFTVSSLSLKVTE